MAQRSFGSRRMLCAILAAAVASVAGSVRGDYVVDGDVLPATDPLTWTTATRPYIGDTSTGSLVINPGTTLTSGTSYIGNSVGGNGTVGVQGTGAQWSPVFLYVGNDGTGVLNITGGGLVNNAARYVGNNAGSSGTVTVDGAGSTWGNGGNLYVGNSGTGVVSVTHGGMVAVEYEYLGYNSGSAGSVTIDGSGSTWASRLGLVVGQSGTGVMNIINGGSVSGSAAVGSGLGSAGTVTVDGKGSTWGTTLLYVGDRGTGLVSVTNGASVGGVEHLGNSTVLGNNTGSCGTVTVDGVGSIWSGVLGVGVSGKGVLSITRGATVNGGGGIASNAGSSGTVTVDGTGSKWTCDVDLTVGNYGSGILNITNGALVTVPGSTYVANGTGSTGAIHFGDYGGTLTTAAFFGGAGQITGVGRINTHNLVTDGALFFDAGHGFNQNWTWSNDQGNVAVNLTVINGTFSSMGAGYFGEGTLTIRDGVALTDTYGYLGYKAGSSGTATVDGTSSKWTCNNALYVGNYGAGNISITHGGLVTATGQLGYNAGSSGAVTVDGTGSKWTGTLCVGNTGAGVMNVTNGGTVTGTGTVGNGAGSSGVVTVDGAGSFWSGNLSVGVSGAGLLSITNRGKVSGSSAGMVGNNPGSSGTVTVDGANSTWTCGGSLTVGNLGSGVLNITNGGLVTATGNLYVANGTGSSGAIAFGDLGGTLAGLAFFGSPAQITGTGAINAKGLVSDGMYWFDKTHGYNQALGWATTQANVTVNLSANNGAWGAAGAGYLGAGTLTVQEAVTLTSTDGYLGYKAGAEGTGTVDGTGSTWTCSNNLYVGNSGAGTLNITHSGKVNSTKIAYLGYNVGASGMMVVDGTASTWTGGTLTIGQYGTGVLSITNGATISGSSYGFLGFNAGGSGTATVDGAKSKWTSGTIYVGYSGKGVLNITNSGAVSAPGIVGYNVGSSGTVTVDGKSSWASSDFSVGSSGTGVLTITNGGWVTASNGMALGGYPGSSGTATVDGLGSSWTGGGNLVVGSSGTGLTNIINGGVVTNSGYGKIGEKAFSSGAVTVDGASSRWSCGSYLRVGNSGSGALSMGHGGKVNNTDCVVGYDLGAYGTAAVDGAGSAWTCTGSLTLGYLGMGIMTITNGGTVSCTNGWAGYVTGAYGSATVDGTGSKWTCSGNLTIGAMGVGELNITNGGLVAVSGTTWLANGTSSSGALHFGDQGGTLTTDTFWGSPVQITGVGTINTHNLVNDETLTFDATHGINQSWAWTYHEEKVTVNLTAVNGTFGTMGAGYAGAGTMTVCEGTAVADRFGYLGYKAGSFGTANVDGTGSTWTSEFLCAGYYGGGTLAVTNGGSAISHDGAMALYGNSSGTATVDGKGSMWTCSGSLTIGNHGAGILNLTNGGVVNVGTTTYVGNETDSTGSIHFGIHGGTLTTATFLGSPARITGTGTINTQNIVTDGNLVFDSTHGPNQTWVWANAEGNVTVNLTSVNGTFSSLGAGYVGAGTLTIRDGVTVTSGDGLSGGILGYMPGSCGTANVDGAGSTWIVNNGHFYIGSYGSGILNITHGGKVTCAIDAYIGTFRNSYGAVTVDGKGSRWVCSESVLVGSANLGSAVLRISNGGTMTASNVSIESLGWMAINVGDGSQLSVGTGNVNNATIVRMTAAPSATAGTYTPIVAGNWTGYGQWQAIGGKWDGDAHVFTVSAARTGVPGVGVTIDRLSQQRVVITDGTTLDRVQVGFGGTMGSSNLTLTAAELTEGEKAGLQASWGGQVLEGWTFAAEGYTAGDPVSLSMKVGSGWSAEQLGVWHYDGTTWTPYAVSDLSYDGTYASFTVTGFSGYAVTVMPEPGSLAVLALGAAAALRRRRGRNSK